MGADHNNSNPANFGGCLPLVTTNGHKKNGSKRPVCRLKPNRANPSSHVRMKGEVYFYQMKAPFSPSGKSIQGALEYDPDKDLVKCHECGDWVESVAIHARREHDISATQYRAKHGFTKAASLQSETRRKLQSAAAVRRGCTHLAAFNVNRNSRSHAPMTVEGLNRNGKCPAQTLHDVKRLAESLGRAPTNKELKRSKISLAVMRFIFGSVSNALKIAGLKRRDSRKPKYTTEQLLECLRTFYRLNGYFPRSSDFRRKLLPGKWCYVRFFGNLTRAWKAAGLPLNESVMLRRGWDLARYRRALEGGSVDSLPARRMRKGGAA